MQAPSWLSALSGFTAPFDISMNISEIIYKKICYLKWEQERITRKNIKCLHN